MIHRVLAMMIAASLAAGALDADAAAPRPRPAQLAAAKSFAFAIGQAPDVRRLSAFDLVVVDGQETTAAQVRALRRRGAIVVAYVSVGTIEAGRPWSEAARPYRKELWQDWGEWYANVAAPGFRRLVTTRIAPSMLRKGFDGLFLDNVDMIETHRDQTAGMRTLVAALARMVQARRGVLFAQNGEAVIGPMLRHLDGWNREDVTGTYDFDAARYVTQPPGETAAAQAALRRIRRSGLLVTATDYVARDDAVGAARAVANACAAGALPFVSDIELRRLPSTPIRCP